MTSRLVLLVSLCAFAATACDPSPRCGSGTVEQGGVCVPTTMLSSGGSPSESESDGDTSPYGACPSGSDVECGDDEACDATIRSCAGSCDEDHDCPDPSDGTAVQICVVLTDYTKGCVLSCAAEGARCPAGLICDDDSGSPSYQFCRSQ
jgi:hypothetical protein